MAESRIGFAGGVLDKNVLLSDATAAALDLAGDATVNEGLRKLAPAALALAGEPEERVRVVSATSDLPDPRYVCGDILYVDGQFVALRKASATTTTAYIYTSPDGVTWTQGAYVGSQHKNDIAYGNGTYVISCGNSSGSSSSYAMYSTDLVTWRTATMPSDSYWTQVWWLHDRFIAVTSYSAAYSYDGATWTACSGSISSSWSCAAYGNGTYVIKSLDDYGYGIVYTSNDGITWTQRSMPNTSSWCNMVFFKGLFWAFETSNRTVWTSPDGETWTQQTTFPSSASNPTPVVWGENLFLFSGGYLFKLDTSGSFSLYAYPPTGGTGSRTLIPVGDTLYNVGSSSSPYITVTYTPYTMPALYSAEDVAGNLIGGFTRCLGGSYIGTGTYGADNPTSILCGFVPRAVIISGGDAALFGAESGALLTCTVSTAKVHLLNTAWDADRLTWYSTESNYASYAQMNRNGFRYFYVIFG